MSGDEVPKKQNASTRGVARGGAGGEVPPLRKEDRIFFKRPIKNLTLIEGTMLVDYGHSTGKNQLDFYHLLQVRSTVLVNSMCCASLLLK